MSRGARGSMDDQSGSGRANVALCATPNCGYAVPAEFHRIQHSPHEVSSGRARDAASNPEVVPTWRPSLAPASTLPAVNPAPPAAPRVEVQATTGCPSRGVKLEGVNVEACVNRQLQPAGLLVNPH